MGIGWIDPRWAVVYIEPAPAMDRVVGCLSWGYMECYRVYLYALNGSGFVWVYEYLAHVKGLDFLEM